MAPGWDGGSILSWVPLYHGSIFKIHTTTLWCVFCEFRSVPCRCFVLFTSCIYFRVASLALGQVPVEFVALTPTVRSVPLLGSPDIKHPVMYYSVTLFHVCICSCCRINTFSSTRVTLKDMSNFARLPNHTKARTVYSTLLFWCIVYYRSCLFQNLITGQKIYTFPVYVGHVCIIWYCDKHLL